LVAHFVQFRFWVFNRIAIPWQESCRCLCAVFVPLHPTSKNSIMTICISIRDRSPTGSMLRDTPWGRCGKWMSMYRYNHTHLFWQLGDTILWQFSYVVQRNLTGFFIRFMLESLLDGVVSIRNVRSKPWCPETELCTRPIRIWISSGTRRWWQQTAIIAGVMLFWTRREHPSATGLLIPRYLQSQNQILVCQPAIVVPWGLNWFINTYPRLSHWTVKRRSEKG
jgi:hypothetical protein